MNSSNPRIKAAFARTAGRTALIPYVTAGDPSVLATPLLMHALVKAGADVLELGIPFSDPMADGPVIQRAAERAIKRGVGLRNVLEMVAQFRQDDTTTPVVLMGYANPIERMGQEAFVQQASKAGVDGVLVVDYPPEEIVNFAAQLGVAQIDPIFLLAPTSTQARIQQVARVAKGYVYYVSLKGVTGAGNIDTVDVAQRLAQIRKHVTIPVGVGFGIRDADSAKRLGEHADAVVIGSKLIETMEQSVARSEQAGLSAADTDAAAIKAAADWLDGIHQVLRKQA
ncbi:tryptophan synthase subunit alpha [Pollutimonas nitritireducens]|uniref:Tryptophan synthase alpha chain n=1 Tax=Pollutimonas nitritireducens TaxID=2045209 RepID=A0A2N4UG92_9BURK|nr:tryptophan synthase subunit alpha [Pollutimonas nitritireducens]PLC54042.1 tryptophan synthase subunit alpha [Pollutimonas nitritireducens]